MVSEAKISSNVPVFVSPAVLDFPKDFLKVCFKKFAFSFPSSPFSLSLPFSRSFFFLSFNLFRNQLLLHRSFTDVVAICEG